jgi:cytochrome c biogenesis factor
MRKGWQWYLVRAGALLLLITLLVLTIVVTSRKNTTNGESALWTFILFAIGLAATYYFGRKSVSEAAADVVRPQARSAGRRIIALGKGIGLFRAAMQEQHSAARNAATENDGKVPIASIELAYATLDLQVEQQMLIVIDALEDWREFDPDIVNELKKMTNA